MTKAFVSFLESMTVFFRVLDIKSRSAAAQAKVHSSEEVGKVADLQAAFREEVLSLFDGFVSQGLDAKEAVKRSNFALKAQNNPWATYETVLSVVRAAGRLRKKRGRPHGNEAQRAE
jgi:hypothetical protein